MSKRRPGKRDRLEELYLATAKERAEVLADYDKRLLEMQAELRRLENGGGDDAPVKAAMTHERIELVVSTLDSSDEPARMADPVGVFGSDGEHVDYRLRAVRMSALLIGVCRCVLGESQPKLFVRLMMLAADLPGAISMRQVAAEYQLSGERISQRVEDIQRRFNLPKNRHNKSAEAVAEYSVNRRVHVHTKQNIA